MECCGSMKRLPPPVSNSTTRNEDAVSHLMEYMIISGIMLLIIVITMPMVSSILVERPVNQLSYYVYTDIANGVSTRIVDMYAMTYDEGTDRPTANVTIDSKFDLPDSVAGRDYYVSISGTGRDVKVVVYRERIISEVSIAGIGTTRTAAGETAGHYVNRITYEYPIPE